MQDPQGFFVLAFTLFFGNLGFLLEMLSAEENKAEKV